MPAAAPVVESASLMTRLRKSNSGPDTRGGGNPPRPSDADEAYAVLQDHLFERFAEIGKAVGNKQRLKLLELLAQTGRTVEALANAAGLSIANVSQHLQLLRAAGLVEAKKTGLYVHYRIAGPAVTDLIRSIRAVAENRFAEFDSIAHGRDANGIEPIDRGELLKRLRRGDAIVIDVRPPEEFHAGHILGAASIPLNELRKRLRDLPRSKEVIAYCRGPYCLLAHRAVEVLRRGGRNARRLADGFPEWAAAGLPVERSAPENPPGQPP